MDAEDEMEIDDNLELIHFTNITPEELLVYWPKYFPNEPHSKTYNVSV